jgi:hypothetical protein
LTATLSIDPHDEDG